MSDMTLSRQREPVTTAAEIRDVGARITHKAADSVWKYVRTSGLSCAVPRAEVTPRAAGLGQESQLMETSRFVGERQVGTPAQPCRLCCAPRT